MNASPNFLRIRMLLFFKKKNPSKVINHESSLHPSQLISYIHVPESANPLHTQEMLSYLSTKTFNHFGGDILGTQSHGNSKDFPGNERFVAFFMEGNSKDFSCIHHVLKREILGSLHVKS